MKISSFLATLLIVLFSVSCSHHHAKPLPPGQAKKITGSKSAKPFAPGQQKKHKKHH